MAMEVLKAWEFDRKSRRFRGQYITPAKFEAARDKYMEDERGRNAALAERLFAREIDINQWRAEARSNLKRQYLTNYTLGKGPDLSQRDYGILGAQLKKQYKFLDNFAKEVTDGRYTEEQARSVASRLNLYTNGSEQALHRGQAEAWGIKLPAYPKDGSSECLNQCLCSWLIEENGATIEATWILGATEEHCTTCPDRAAKWVKLKFDNPNIDPAKYTPEYLDKLKLAEEVRQNGEFYEGELQDIGDQAAAELKMSQAARRYGYEPGKMSQSDWTQIAERLREDALDNLGLATKEQREAAGNQAAGRRLRRLDDNKEFIQLGGQAVERTWLGGSRRAAEQATRRINRRTEAAARDYMTGQLQNFGYLPDEIDGLNYTQQRRLLAEIGSKQRQSQNIAKIDKARRQEIIDNASKDEAATAREIAYNPRSAEGMEIWGQYELAMIKAGRGEEIEIPPDARESNIPAYVTGKQPKKKKKQPVENDFEFDF